MSIACAANVHTASGTAAAPAAGEVMRTVGARLATVSPADPLFAVEEAVGRPRAQDDGHAAGQEIGGQRDAVPFQPDAILPGRAVVSAEGDIAGERLREGEPPGPGAEAHWMVRVVAQLGAGRRGENGRIQAVGRQALVDDSGRYPGDATASAPPCCGRRSPDTNRRTRPRTVRLFRRHKR